MSERSNAHRLGPVLLRPLLEELGSEFAGLAEQKGIELHVLTAAAAVVSSQTDLLEALLRNLIRNAIHYTPRGERVLIACRKRGSEVQIEVRDNGIGIPPDQLARIFEAFQRVDATRSDGPGARAFHCQARCRVARTPYRSSFAVSRGSCFVVAAKRVSANEE